MRRFLITGCGRSGTMYTARLLNKLGIRTSHEEFFTAYTPPSAVVDYPGWLVSTRTVGEVSGLAAPHLPRLSTDVVQIHQVRNPVAVISSLMGLRDFHPESHGLANIKFNFRHLPKMQQEDEPLILAMKYWGWWNAMVEVSSPGCARVRAERLRTQGGVKHLLSAMDKCLPSDRVQAAIEAVPDGINSGPRDYSVNWGMLPLGALKADILNMATVYGYSAEDLKAYDPRGPNGEHVAVHGKKEVPA